MLRLAFIMMSTIVFSFPGSCLSVTPCPSATFLAQTPISFHTDTSDLIHNLVQWGFCHWEGLLGTSRVTVTLKQCKSTCKCCLTLKATVLNTVFPAVRIFCAEMLNLLSILKKVCLDQRMFWIGGKSKITCNLLVSF